MLCSSSISMSKGQALTTLSTDDSYTLSLVIREVRRQWRTLGIVVVLMFLGTASVSRDAAAAA